MGPQSVEGETRKLLVLQEVALIQISAGCSFCGLDRDDLPLGYSPAPFYHRTCVYIHSATCAYDLRRDRYQPQLCLGMGAAHRWGTHQKSMLSRNGEELHVRAHDPQGTQLGHDRPLFRCASSRLYRCVRGRRRHHLVPLRERVAAAGVWDSRNVGRKGLCAGVVGGAPFGAIHHGF